MRTLREENASLEERITSLCESPFINNAFDKRERLDKVMALERDNRQMRVQVQHLQETVRTQHAELVALRQQAQQLTSERDALRAQAEGLQAALEQTRRGQELLQDKVRLFATDGGVEVEELERALALVRRQRDAPSAADILGASAADAAGAAAGAEAVPVLRRKVHSLQVSLLTANQELERTEKMLAAQTAINRDLAEEIKELSAARGADTDALRRKVADFEALADTRAQRARALEAQNKQLMRRVAQLQQQLRTSAVRGRAFATIPEAGALHDSPRASMTLGAGAAAASVALPAALAAARGDALGGSLGGGTADLQSELSFSLSEAELGPSENLLEVWVVEAALDPTKVPSRATTFIMVDFFDYETQTTPLATGSSPAYNFAASYKVRARLVAVPPPTPPDPCLRRCKPTRSSCATWPRTP